jgi:hypothetical protein
MNSIGVSCRYFASEMRAPSWILASALRASKSTSRAAEGRFRPGFARDFGAMAMVVLVSFLGCNNVILNVRNIVIKFVS